MTSQWIYNRHIFDSPFQWKDLDRIEEAFVLTQQQSIYMVYPGMVERGIYSPSQLGRKSCIQERNRRFYTSSTRRENEHSRYPLGQSFYGGTYSTIPWHISKITSV